MTSGSLVDATAGSKGCFGHRGIPRPHRGDLS